MVSVQTHFKRLYCSKRFELFLELLGFDLLWNVANKYICHVEFVFILAEEVTIELESSAWLAFNLEVSHLLASYLVLNWVLDVDDCGVKRLGNIFLDLRS